MGVERLGEGESIPWYQFAGRDTMGVQRGDGPSMPILVRRDAERPAMDNTFDQCRLMHLKMAAETSRSLSAALIFDEEEEGVRMAA